MRTQTLVVAAMLAFGSLAHAGVVAGEAADPATGANNAAAEKAAVNRTHNTGRQDSQGDRQMRSGLDNMRGAAPSRTGSAYSSRMSSNRGVHQ